VRVTRIVVAASVVVLGVLCYLAAIGFTAVIAPLVTVAVLIVLVAGGNLLSGRPSPPRPTTSQAEQREAER